MTVRVNNAKAEAAALELGLLTSNQVVAATGISYRMLDHYTRLSWITPIEGPQGQGYARLFDPSVVATIQNLRRRIEACPIHPHGRVTR